MAGQAPWRFEFPAFHLSERSLALAVCHLLAFVDRSLKLDPLISIPPVTDPLLLFLNTSHQHKCEVVVDGALQRLPPTILFSLINSQADL